MCIDREFTTSLLKNMIRNLGVAHNCYIEHPEVCLDQCEEYFLSYELLAKHMNGIYQTTDKHESVGRNYDALAHSIASEEEKPVE